MHNDKHRRQSVRLRGFDYSQPGAYFVTISTRDRECLFGEIVGGETRLNDSGRVVESECLNTEQVRPQVALDGYVVMPNHFHGILVILDRRGVWPYAPATSKDAPATDCAPRFRSASQTVGAIVRGFKAAVTKRIKVTGGAPGLPVWQRNYYEHVIRNERELERIREYIANNPIQWAMDLENPMAVPPAPGCVADDIGTIFQVAEP